MKTEGDAKRDWRTLSLVVLGLVILVFIANIHLEVRGEVESVDISSRFVHSAIISFTMVNGALFMITLALSHKHAKLIEQALGTILAAVAGVLIFGLLMGGIRIIIVGFAILLAFGASFGLLLTLVTGRETPPDPLLELESASFENEDE